MMLLRAPVLLASAALLAACDRAGVETPAFLLDQCERVALIDSSAGTAIVGAEDLDIDRIGGRLFVSAYDRRAAEKAVHDGADEVPEGGLYAVKIADIATPSPSVAAHPLVDRNQVAGGLRPHGISYDQASGDLFFINRRYVRDGSRWRLAPQIVTLSPSGDLKKAAEVHCAANDILALGERTFITLDHAGCGWRGGAEDLFGWKGARLVDENGDVIARNLNFANGVAALSSDVIFVAGTRERALYSIGVTSSPPRVEVATRLGAAPDNLTLSGDGRIIAAAHPSLLAIGLQRRLGAGRSPSRVIEIDPATGGLRLLFDDPNGTLIAAATVAVVADDILILGSVVDPGLVICRGAS